MEESTCLFDGGGIALITSALPFMGGIYEIIGEMLFYGSAGKALSMACLRRWGLARYELKSTNFPQVAQCEAQGEGIFSIS